MKHEVVCLKVVKKRGGGGEINFPEKKTCSRKNRPKRPKRKLKIPYTNHPFSSAFAVSFREGMYSKMLSEPRKIPWLFRVYRGLYYPVI